MDLQNDQKNEYQVMKKQIKFTKNKMCMDGWSYLLMSCMAFRRRPSLPRASRQMLSTA